MSQASVKRSLRKYLMSSNQKSMILRKKQNMECLGGPVTEAIRRDRVKSSRVPLAAFGTIILSTLCNAEFS